METTGTHPFSLRDRLSVRETIEDYLHFVDARDWAGVAACFAADAQSHYNFEPRILVGGLAVADWTRERLAAYLGTDHALGHLHIEFDGTRALCTSSVTASLLHETGGTRRIAVRTLRYRDVLECQGDRWLISQRIHEPQWQYEVAAADLRV